ncbi:MAG: hypothetical protein M4579_005004 [Chaenotheca gracillima]|nr:MAG: hypothetical protein M4579_005004 [Chaenotheca gracillima]
MPPRPFPFPLSIGIDICYIPRIRQIITKDEGRQLSRFARRIFHPDERPGAQKLIDRYERARAGRGEGCGHADNIQTRGNLELSRLSEWIAGRFAAKEAAMKAVNSRRLTWHDILVGSTGKGPTLTILDARNPRQSSMNDSGKERSTMARSTLEQSEEPGSQVARISISHDGEYATAVVMVAENDSPPVGLGETST